MICLGNNTHRVLRAETMTKEDESISQRHELVGVKRIYEYFDQECVPIKTHAHDNNNSVTKYVKEEREPTINAKDTWHVTKGITREAKKITAGTIASEGVKWHPELSDKATGIRTHIFYSMKNCDGDSKKLRASIDNVVNHYKGNHEKCNPESRCKIDAPYYCSRKTPITDPNAEEILKKYLKKLPVYKEADSYPFCIDTHYVE